MEVKTCSVDGCPSVPFVVSSGKCIVCHLITDGEALKTHERPRQPPIWHHTKVKPKMFVRGRL
jgi:hypothetical protein